MSINTKVVLLSLKGESLKDENDDLTLGIAISNIIMTSETGGKMKLYTLAQKFYNQDIIELDPADFSMVKEAVKATKIYNALVAGQIESILEEVK